MTTILKIDGEAISVAELLQTLKLTGQFEGLIEQFVRDRITVRAAKKQGVRVSDEEIQERADQFRRVRGLHRASDTNKYLDALGVGLDEFEAFLSGRPVPGEDDGSRSAATRPCGRSSS